MQLEVIPAGKTTATVILTQAQVDKIRGSEGKARVPLLIKYKGQDFRTSVSVYRGQWMTVINAEMRAGGLAPGGTYTVDISMDTAERTVDVPADLATALKNAGVLAAFNKLSYTHRKEHVRSVIEAKREETRIARIQKVIDKLS
jgi:hypothetical protein